MSIELYPHNLDAYRCARTLLMQTGKAAVIHPTGTGKSFIAFKLCEDFGQSRVLWLSPSEYIFEVQLAAAKKNGFTAENTIFYTYARLVGLSDEEMAALAPDYIILDEFHRAGAKEWGRAVCRLLTIHAGVPVLGLSATNVRYLDNCRDMADELFEGNVASRMTLGEAIARGILAAPVYVTALYGYEDELARYERRVRRAKSAHVRDAAEKYLQALRRALEKADGLEVVFQKYLNPNGKYLVFCADSRHMDTLIEKADTMFAFAPEKRIYRAYSGDLHTERQFHAFVDDGGAGLRLLYCIDMLNEGIHVADVDGVILFRPTVSPIVYKQQIGRALTVGVRDKPVILDIVNNFENLYSVGVIEEEMNKAIGYYRMTGENKLVVNERFRIIDEMHECRALFNALEDALTASWECMYACAARYFFEHGDLNIPQRYKTAEGYSLGSWITTQRSVYRGSAAGLLTEDRIAKLNEIGMVWDDYRSLAFERGISAAERYVAEHGNLDVSSRYTDNDGYPLGSWIATMRRQRSGEAYTGILTKERAERLTALGMIWDKTDYLFERNFAAAKAYYAAFGDLNVPARYKTADGINLGSWIHDLRRRRQSLSEEQVARLTAIGMDWRSVYERSFEEGCAALERYLKAYGNTDVPCAYVSPSGFKLGSWLAARRVNGGKKLSPKKRARLTAMGVCFDTGDPWEKKYLLAKQYFEMHGDLNVPPNYRSDGVWLFKWLNEQKQIYRGNRAEKQLSAEQIAKLERIGIHWGQNNDEAWDKQFAAAEQYYHEHGDLNIPKSFCSSDGKCLGQWLVVQRRKHREGKLSADKISRLEQIGMRWGSWERVNINSGRLFLQN